MTRSVLSRRVTRFVGVVVAITIVGVAASACGDGGSGGRDGAAAPRSRERSAGASSATAPSVASPRATWSAPTAGGEPMGVIADADGVIAVSYQAVQSIDPADGTERWHTGIGRAPEIAPVRAAVDGDLVAVPTSDGVTALARSDGHVLWKAGFGPGLVAAGRTGPTALARVSGGPPLVLGTNSGTLVAFDRGSGAARWRARFDGEIVTAPAVDDATGVAVVLWHVDDGDGHLRALDLVSGSVRWETATLSKTAAPVVRDGSVLLSEGDNFSHARVRALDVATGTTRWETVVPKSFEWETEPGAAGDDYVTVDHFGTVTDVDIRTGAVRWQRSGDWALLDTQVVVGAEAVAFHDFGGHVVVLDRATGAVRSVTRPDGSVLDSALRGDLLVTAVNVLGARRFEARPLGPSPVPGPG